MRSATSEFKPGDRVVWVRSPGRSILESWKVQRIPGVVVRVCRRRVGIRARLGGTEKLVIVDPENLIPEDGTGDLSSQTEKYMPDEP